jgi:ABC-type arginine transport system ATPase subunit
MAPQELIRAQRAVELARLSQLDRRIQETRLLLEDTQLHMSGLQRERSSIKRSLLDGTQCDLFDSAA